MGQIRGIWPKQLKYRIYPESGVFGYIHRRMGHLAHIPGYRPNTGYLAYIPGYGPNTCCFRPVLAWNRPISSINTPKPPQNDPKWPKMTPFLAGYLPAPFLKGVQKGGVFLTFDPCFWPSKNGPKSEIPLNPEVSAILAKKGQNGVPPFLTKNGRFLDKMTPFWTILEVKGLKWDSGFDPKMAKDWPWPVLG